MQTQAAVVTGLCSFYVKQRSSKIYTKIYVGQCDRVLKNCVELSFSFFSFLFVFPYSNKHFLSVGNVSSEQLSQPCSTGEQVGDNVFFCSSSSMKVLSHDFATMDNVPHQSGSLNSLPPKMLAYIQSACMLGVSICRSRRASCSARCPTKSDVLNRNKEKQTQWSGGKKKKKKEETKSGGTKHRLVFLTLVERLTVDHLFVCLSFFCFFLPN